MYSLIAILVLSEKNLAIEEENAELRETNEALKREVTCLKGKMSGEREKSGLSVFWTKTPGRIRSQGGRALSYGKPLKDAVLQCLARGVESTSVQRVMTKLARGMTLDDASVPSLSLINDWRQNDLAVLNDRQLNQFLSDAESLTVCLDCASFSDHKASSFVVECLNVFYR